MKKIVLCVVTGIALTASGCKMEDLAAESARNSNRAANASTQVMETSSSGYMDARAGSTRESRFRELGALINSDSKIAEAAEKAKAEIEKLLGQYMAIDPTDAELTKKQLGIILEIGASNLRAQQAASFAVNKRATSATVYLVSFEHQLWKEAGLTFDTQEKRLELFQDGVAELLNKLQSLPEESKAAVAAMLHKVHRSQKSASERYEFTETVVSSSPEIKLPKVVSALDLLVAGLKARKLVEKGDIQNSSLPEFAKVVGDQDADALAILKLRYNVLVKSVISTIMPKDALKMANGLGVLQAKEIQLPEIDPATLVWAPDWSKLNDVATVESYTTSLLGALQMKQIFAELGEKDALDLQMSLVMQVMQVKVPLAQTPRETAIATSVEPLLKLLAK